MRGQYFKMPHFEEYKKLQDALWDYYELCLPQYGEDERYDLSRDALISIEDTMRRHYKENQVERE